MQMRRLLHVLTAGVGVGVFLSGRPALAMPNFAQATGLQCSACHLSVPGLNANGRYVQRTAFTAIPMKTLERALPIWFSEQATYDSQAGYEPHRVQFGNANFHLDGGVGSDVTFHIQQWIVEGDQTGTLDTAWVSYNNLINREAHLFAGYAPMPSPSVYQFWMDINPFSVAEYTVGEHTEGLDANRWGAKLNFEPKNFTIELGYGSAGYPADFAYSQPNDKAFQWRVAYARPKSPIEIGTFGSDGTTPLAEGGVDRYYTAAAYAELDPQHHLPGGGGQRRCQCRRYRQLRGAGSAGRIPARPPARRPAHLQHGLRRESDRDGTDGRQPRLRGRDLLPDLPPLGDDDLRSHGADRRRSRQHAARRQHRLQLHARQVSAGHRRRGLRQ